MNTEKFWQNIDKLILTLLFCLCVVCAVWMTIWMSAHRLMDEGSLDWMRLIVSDLLSGLLGLMGGRAIERAMNSSTNIQPHDNASVTVQAPESPKPNG